MMNRAPKRQFISGAVCPRCSEHDTIIVYKTDEQDYRECVECGFNEAMRFKPQVNELTTRVNKSEVDIKRETQVVRFVNSPEK